MDTIQKTNKLEGVLIDNGFYLVSGQLSPDGYNHLMTISCSTSNREQELIALIEDQGWTSASCTYHAISEDTSNQKETFQPYYVVSSVTPDIFHKI